MKRHKTEYPGVFYREAVRIGGKGKEKVFYVVFKKNGKVYEEKAGRQYADDMTAARAARIRGQLIEGKRQTRPEKREAERFITEKWTIKKLWDEYKKNHTNLKGLVQDECRFRLHIDPSLGNKEPSELVPLDVDRIRIKLLKTQKPATVRNVLELLRRIISYATKKQLCNTPGFRIEMPTVNNIKTEDLNHEQMENLLRVLREGTVTDQNGKVTALNRDAREAMLMALYTGMRAGEISKLQWDDIDFRRGFISIKDPKGGPDQTIPLSDSARELLANRPRSTESRLVFSGINNAKAFRAIRDAAGLPKDFRPMHGLRHAFASNLASSGQVDLYTIQRLLTHKSPAMTQRYAHLRDETLRSASNLAGSIIDQVVNAENREKETTSA